MRHYIIKTNLNSLPILPILNGEETRDKAVMTSTWENGELEQRQGKRHFPSCDYFVIITMLAKHSKIKLVCAPLNQIKGIKDIQLYSCLHNRKFGYFHVVVYRGRHGILLMCSAILITLTRPIKFLTCGVFVSVLFVVAKSLHYLRRGHTKIRH